MRWWKLAGLATAGLAALAAVTWAVFWIQPPEPAQLVVLVAGYDNTLAVPPNPYGKAAARELAELTKPGGWLGNRSRLNGSINPAKLTRSGLTELFPAHGKCVVVVLAAHGGRDRDGAFLFPEDSTGDPTARVRISTLIEQLGKLPAKQQKLLILDATEPPAYADLGLVHNDFAAAVEDLNDAIAKVPNLAVFMSTGPDQRSWTSPEWGQSAFLYHVLRGLRGAADANGDKRISGAELVGFVRPRVHDWARDHRAALQTPVLLPKGDEGESRIAAMHLAMTDGPPPEETAPTPFDPPPELAAAWQEYRDLATAYVPPTAYTPHLWRQYEAWTLRFEQHIIAGDSDGAQHARTKAIELKRQIEAARRLDIGPQTLAIQSAVGGLPWVPRVPDIFKERIGQLAGTESAEQPAVWSKLRSVPGYDLETSRVLWCRALIEWVAGDPLTKLPKVPALVPFVTEGMSVRPTEINFLLMLARHLPPVDKKEALGPLLGQVLQLRLATESSAGAITSPGYPFSESVRQRNAGDVAALDIERRKLEDLCFTSNVDARRLAEVEKLIAAAKWIDTIGPGGIERGQITSWQRGEDRLPGCAEWIARATGDETDPDTHDKLSRAKSLLLGTWTWSAAHNADPTKPFTDQTIPDPNAKIVPRGSLSDNLDVLDAIFLLEVRKQLQHKPEFVASPTPRVEAVKWWHAVDSLLTASPSHLLSVAERPDLVREFRRVSRQLLVTGLAQPEQLPEVSAAKAREVAFEAAQRRGLLLLARIGNEWQSRELFALKPGESWHNLNARFDQFAFLAAGRQSLAEAGSRLGELLGAVSALGEKTDNLATAEYWIRIAPTHAAVSDEPINLLRRQRVRDYLVAQARRTYLDHWYGEGDSRYYHTAIEHLVADARGLRLPTPKDDPFAPYLGAEPFPVTPSAPQRFAVTDEPNPKLKVTFDRNKLRDIEGFPVFWSSPAFPQAKPEPEVRVPVSTNRDEPLPAFVRPIARPTGPIPTFPVAESSTVRVTGFFRGRTLATNVGVDVYRLPDSVAVTTPGLTSTAVAVRADLRVRDKYGWGTGAIAIVLDCSGSLGPPDPKNPKDRGLYPDALQALDILLRQLPPGTIITVSVFGQRVPGVEEAEQTIHEVQPPITLEFNTKPIIDKVNREVGNLEPWNPSPIVRSVIRAKDRIKNEAVPFKAVVLISDGVDNRFADDPENKTKQSIRDALRSEFPDAGVALAVLALPVYTKAEAAVQAEFAEAEKLKPVGKFLRCEKEKDIPAKAKELAAWLRSGLNLRVRFTLDPLGRLGGGDLTAGTDTADNWYHGRLEPGTYRFAVSGAKEFAKTVLLEPGDRLLIDLTEDRNVITAKRHWWADTAPGIKSEKPADWRLSLLQNRSEAGGLRLFTAIEDEPKPTSMLVVSRIGDVWFEPRPVVPNPMAVAARWRAAPGYPAPAWSVNIPGWPLFPGSKAAASPVVEAWWYPDRPFPAAGAWTLPADETLISEKPRAVKIGDTALSLDSITIEEHAVEVAPGGKTEPQKCLVVRLSHPARSPMWVRPVAGVGEVATGSEIRVYRAANRVTCLFWGIDAEKVTGFEVVSLNDSLKRADKLGFHATLDNVPGPTDTSPRPEPPVELR